MEWNKPARSDYYLMQIAAEIRRPNLKKAAQRKLEVRHMRIPFKQQNAAPNPVNAKLAAEQSKQMWLRLLPNIQRKESPPGGG